MWPIHSHSCKKYAWHHSITLNIYLDCHPLWHRPIAAIQAAYPQLQPPSKLTSVSITIIGVYVCLSVDCAMVKFRGAKQVQPTDRNVEYYFCLLFFFFKYVLSLFDFCCFYAFFRTFSYVCWHLLLPHNSIVPLSRPLCIGTSGLSSC